MSKRSIKKKQAAKKMRKLNKRRMRNLRKLKQNQNSSKQVPSQKQTSSEDSVATEKTDKEKFDFEALFTFIILVLVVIFFVGMMGFLVYVLCFEHPDSTEQENPSISMSKVNTQDEEDTNILGSDKNTSKGSKEPELAETSPKSEEDLTQSIPKLEAKYLFYDVTEHTTEDLIAVASTLEFRQGGWPEGYNWRLYKNPDVKLPSNDPLEISILYADLYNKDEWTGFPVERDGFRISYDNRGRMEVNGELTGVQTNIGLFYDIAEELYRRGEWDGFPIILGSHTIEVSEDCGSLGPRHYCIDFPDEFDIEIDSDYAYILGEGAYLLSNQTLVKFINQEMITLSGRKLKLTGIDLSKQTPYNFHLRYSKTYDKLFLFVRTCSNEYYEDGMDESSVLDIPNEVRTFLYEFPDYNVSEVKLISEITDSYWSSNDVDIYYWDKLDFKWKLGENGFYRLEYSPGHQV